jgi:hypothetical protein
MAGAPHSFMLVFTADNFDERRGFTTIFLDRGAPGQRLIRDKAPGVRARRFLSHGKNRLGKIDRGLDFRYSIEDEG